MKFLLEFVSSCGSFSSRVVEEETKSLVPPAEARRPRGRKRERLVAVRRGGGGQVAEWRPTLSSISEDNVLPERNGSNVVASERMKRNKASSTATPKPRSHDYRDDVGRAQASLIIPALAPTPFLF